jgi:Rod binding domain-containing protein
MVRPVAPTQVSPASTPETRELARVAKELEGVFLRQLLAASKFGEEAGKSGFGTMVVDALASSVAEGGGIGLAQRITDALEVAENPRKTGQEVPK